MRTSVFSCGLARTLAAICLWIQVVGSTQAAAEPALAVFHSKIEGIIRKALLDSGAPSASVAVVKDGRLVFAGAAGSARLETHLQARTQMRYCIGSITKQFTAAALLLLAEQGKLSIDDKVARFLPALSRANDVSIRMLLSHTSGYRDYWPQDYVMPSLIRPTTIDGILQRWARRPLEFEPGTDWQYSNTNFVIAARIVELASGMPFMRFLRSNVLQPLGLHDVVDLEAQPLSPTDPSGYMRYGLGPLRPAPRMGQGWLFGMGQLAMTASELARWDISLIERRLLKESSYAELMSETRLKNGIGTHYGLGITIDRQDGLRTLQHDGEVSGFSANNVVFPDQGAAIVVLVNQDAAFVADEIISQIKPLLFDADDLESGKALARDQQIFVGLQRGTIDRSLLTENASGYFSPAALKDFMVSLGPLGTPSEFKQTSHQWRGGMLRRTYQVKLGGRTLRAWSRELSGGKLEEFLVSPAGSE